MIKAVIFDMFETLITHYGAPLYFGREIAADMDIPEAKLREVWDPSDAERTLGQRTLEDVIEEIMQRNDLHDDALYAKILEKRRAAKLACFEHLHPGILPMLDALRARGMQIGLITNCYFEEAAVIRGSVLFPYFDAACLSCEEGLAKPDPAIYERCLARLGRRASECLYVGDGGSMELETADAVGMHAAQACWYLRENMRDPAVRRAQFAQLEAPGEMLTLL